VGAAHLAAGLLAESEGVAAKVIGRAGLTGEQLVAAVGPGPPGRHPARTRKRCKSSASLPMARRRLRAP
jgi:hypothetical protein